MFDQSVNEYLTIGRAKETWSESEKGKESERVWTSFY